MIITIISLILIVASLVMLVYSYFIMIKNSNYPIKNKKTDKYCILIPARNESKVIEDLLISIENQTYKINPNDVYVIVENKEDKTVEITNKHKMNIIYRKDLTKKRKGYALDEAIKEILKQNKKYEAYFIFDADNILDKEYIKEMTKSIKEGYDIGISYRNTKNGDNLVSGASALTFSMINTIGNTLKNKYTNNLTISGTGYYIRGYLIEKWKGFPFNSLTEDYELTLYSTLNNLTTTYNEEAIFYDEQPEDFKVSIIQRTRWVKGYFEARKKYIKKIRKSLNKNDINYGSKVNVIIGVRPYIYLIIGIILLLISAITNNNEITTLKTFIIILLTIYIELAIISYIMIKKERGKLNLKVSKTKLILYNPIFLLSYVVCLIISIFKRDLGWQEVKHSKTLNK